MAYSEAFKSIVEAVIEIKNPILKKIGGVITLVCLGFIAFSLTKIQFDWRELSCSKNRMMMLGFTILGVGTLYLVAYGWSLLVHFIEPKAIKKRQLISIYIHANIAKYLPGNVMNLVGRNLLAAQLGYKQANVALSTVVEIIIFAGTIVVLALAFSMNKWQQVIDLILRSINIKWLSIIGLVGITLIGVAICLLIRKKQKREDGE